MSTPDRLSELIDDGIIDEVIRPLKSGKEAAVFIVRCDGELCAAKVYKGAQQRNFRQRQDYTEGRQVGDSRKQRAMDKGSRFGKQQQEEAWQNSEADAMYKLSAAGVRIPRPRNNTGGVLIMDLVLDANGDPAPQLASLRPSREEALRFHAVIIHEIAGMLCAGLVHGDLSEFNILAAADGPMIIDLPQALDAARNNNAKRLLLRDVANVRAFLGHFAPELNRTDYGSEMWLLHENSALRPDTPLTGRYEAAKRIVDTQGVLREIEDAKREAAWREERNLKLSKARGNRPGRR